MPNAVPATAPRTEPVWRAAWLAVVLVTACGKVTDKPADAATDAPIDAAIDAPPDAAPITDRNCIEVKAHLGTAADGVYPIDPDATSVRFKPFQVFCAGMATATPKEYLELARRSSPGAAPSSNYGTYVTSADHGQLMCDCGTFTMVFSKVRIDPATLTVDPEDRTFAVFTDAAQATCWQNHPGCHPADFTIIPSYAIARSCITGGTDASGRANVDLRDMPFHVAGTSSAMFMGVGFQPLGDVMIDADRKQVNLTGGGNCGGFGAGAGLTLAQDF